MSASTLIWGSPAWGWIALVLPATRKKLFARKNGGA